MGKAIPQPRVASAEVADALAAVRLHSDLAPEVGIVLGSGLGGLAETVEQKTVMPYEALPGFPATTVAGHKGQLVLGALGKRKVAVLQGRTHSYEEGRIDAMAVPIRTLAGLGCRTLLLTSSAGSLRPEWHPGSVMLVADHINFTGRSPLMGLADDSRFVDMVDAYDPALRARLRAAAEWLGQPMREGVYLCTGGPQFETPAEIRAMRALGADAVGMSTVPEVILARHAGLRVAALVLITNLAAGMSQERLSHAHTLASAKTGAAAVERLLLAFLDESEG